MIRLRLGEMAPPRKKAKPGLSHDEIWDDSALIQSWDDALEEYQVGVATVSLISYPWADL